MNDQQLTLSEQQEREAARESRTWQQEHHDRSPAEEMRPPQMRPEVRADLKLAAVNVTAVVRQATREMLRSGDFLDFKQLREVVEEELVRTMSLFSRYF